MELHCTVCMLYFHVVVTSLCHRRPHRVPGTNNEQEASKGKNEQYAEVQFHLFKAKTSSNDRPNLAFWPSDVIYSETSICIFLLFAT